MKNLFHLFALILTLSIMGCPGRDCTKGPVVGRFALTEEGKGWLPDTSNYHFSMQSQDSITESWDIRGFAGTSWRESVDFDACLRFDGEYSSRRHETSLNRWSCSIGAHAFPDDTQLRIDFRRFVFYYYLDAGTVEVVSTSAGRIETTASVLDSVVVRGKTYQTVLFAENDNPEVVVRKLWCARSVGPIRFEERGGMIWERVE